MATGTINKIKLKNLNNTITDTLKIAVDASDVTYSGGVNGLQKLSNLQQDMQDYVDNEVNNAKQTLNDSIDSLNSTLTENANEAVKRIAIDGQSIKYYKRVGNNLQLIDSISLPAASQITLSDLPLEFRDAVRTAMTASTYDTHGRKKDIFDEIDRKEIAANTYTDGAITGLKTYVDNRDTATINRIISLQNYNINGLTYTGLKAAIEGACTQSKDAVYYTNKYTVDGVVYTGLVSALSGILNRIKTTEIYSVNGHNYNGLLNALSGLINEAKIYIENATYTIDGTTYAGLITTLEGILSLAKDYTDLVSDDVATLREYVDAQILSANGYTNDQRDAAIVAAETYTDSALESYVPYNVEIVSSRPSDNLAKERTFYLIDKGNGKYEKWWYIDDGTGNKIWDNFGSSSTKVVTTLPSSAEVDADTDYILKTNDGCVYYKWINNKWEIITGSSALFVNELPLVGNEYTDYYVKDNSNNIYIHYRYTNGAFVQIGSSLTNDIYTKNEVDTLLQPFSSLSSTVDGHTRAIGNLQDALSGIDTTKYAYDVTYQTETIEGQLRLNVFTLYKYLEDTPDVRTIVNRFQIQGGGGGGGAEMTTLSVSRITPSPYTVTKNDTILLQYNYSSVNSANEDVAGRYSWKIGSRIIATGDCIKGVNTFDATEFCTNIGLTELNLTITDDGGSMALRTFRVQKVDIYIESDFDDKRYIPLGQGVEFSYIPHGAITKTIHFKLDGQETTETTSLSNVTLGHTISAQTYGSHLLLVWITAVINGMSILTNHIYKDIIWYDAHTGQNPIISCIYRYDYYGRAAVKQYDKFPIVYYVYDPDTNYPTVLRYFDGVLIDRVTLSNNEDIWNFQSGDVGLHTLKLKCKSTEVLIVIQVNLLGIDITPVTSGLQIDFNPNGLTNSSENRIWSNNTYSMTVSNNFDWSGGGYQIDEYGDTYFLIKSGSYVTFDYRMFSGGVENNLTKRDGAELKICFMVENVQDVNAVWLTNVETSTMQGVDSETGATVTKTVNLGLQMAAHLGWLKTSQARSAQEGETSEGVAASNTYLYMPYSEEDMIEMDINIDPIGNKTRGFILSYEDGVPSKAFMYDNTHRFYQDVPQVLKIGSDKCDIRIYRLKIYSRSLSTTEVMRNFIADAKNSATILDRYNRNCIYYDNEKHEYTPYQDKGVLDPEKLAVKVPNVKILMLETDHFTKDKKTFVKSSLRCIHAPGGSIYPGDPYLDNWYFENGYHAGQGTTSDHYGQAGRNVDFLFNCDGIHKPSDRVNAEANYISRVTKGYQTLSAFTEACTDWKGDAGKIALTRTSVPNNFFNLKVNIASSENVNNWLLQKRYSDFLPYISPGKQRDSKVKNDMEFVPAILFIKETNTETTMENNQLTYTQHTEFNDTNWHFYALGNIGDSKKTDYTRSYDPTDMNEFTIEISDNVKNNATFQTGVYEGPNHTRVIETFTENNGTATPDVAIQDFIYPITLAEWNDVRNFRHWTIEHEPFDGDHSFEPRYACCGDYRDGKLVNDTSGYGNEQVTKNEEVWKAFYKWVITSTDEQFKTELDQWCVRSAVEFFYAFTHYYTMMDNRAKNTFWHFAKTGTYRQVSRPVPELLHIYHELINNEYVPTSDVTINNNKTYYTQYAFDLWDYDNDTALGINNNGLLVFPYGKLDTDYSIDGDTTSGLVFNGARSVFWCRLRDLLSNEIAAIFSNVSYECFNASNLLNQFDTMQGCYPEEIWRLDILRKYIRTFTGNSVDNSITELKTNVMFLRDMMQGRKKYQRRQWVRDQSIYFGTKYLMNNVSNDTIIFRSADPGSTAVVQPDYKLRITPFVDMYVAANYGNTGQLRKRAKAGQEVVLDFSSEVTSNAETQIVIYGASKIEALNDLSACYIIANPDFSNAEKLKKLVLGNPTQGYNNAKLAGLELGNNRMLQELDLRNCRALSGVLNLSEATNLTKIYAENTRITAVTFATNGKLQIAHLPNTIQNLTMRNLNDLTDFQCTLDYIYSLTLLGGNLDNRQIVTETLDTLRELYLYSINWTLTSFNLLKTMMNLAYSSLTGYVYIDGPTGRNDVANAQLKWPDLDILVNPNKIIEQHLVTYLNTDVNLTELYHYYADQGDYPIDPYLLGLIKDEHDVPYTPSKPSTAQSDFIFGSEDANGDYIRNSGWDDRIDEVISGPTTIRAKYRTVDRYYTVTWYQTTNVPLWVEDHVKYGTAATYPGSLPSRADEEQRLVYHLFKGWDKSTANIKLNTDVYAVWEDISGSPDITKKMHSLTPCLLYSIAKTNKQDAYQWTDGDHIDITLGHDFDYLNVNSVVIGEDVLLPGLERDKYSGSNGYVFNLSRPVTTSLQLLTADAPSFTIAIDFQFSKIQDSDNGCTLISTFEGNTKSGFRIFQRYDGYVVLLWGNKNRQIGYLNRRDIVILRHLKGSRVLYVYDSYNGGTSYFATTPGYTMLESSNDIQTEEPITFGGIHFGKNESGEDVYRDRCKATLHWCKIWFDDLGDSDCRLLSQWPREKLRMEYYGANRYFYANGALTSKGTWISNSLIGGIQGSTLNSNNNSTSPRAFNAMYSSTNSSSYAYWADSNMRTILNSRFFSALPFEWQSMIKRVEVKSYNYNNSQMVTTNDYIFVPSYREVGATSTEQRYKDEMGNIKDPISWFSTQKYRYKFCGISRKYGDATYVEAASEPTSYFRQSYLQGTLWQISSSSTAYMFMPEDFFNQYGIIKSYSADTEVMASGGGWIPAYAWTTRSPYSYYYYYMYFVTNYGALSSNSNSTINNPICFSI